MYQRWQDLRTDIKERFATVIDKAGAGTAEKPSRPYQQKTQPQYCRIPWKAKPGQTYEAKLRIIQY